MQPFAALAQAIPLSPDTWNYLYDGAAKADALAYSRLAMFVAQLSVETANFSRFEENLNYSASGLMKIWPSRFDAETADQFAHQPEKIANAVYANRLGNGPPESGDGWRYRGRGAIQTTGRTNYERLRAALGIDFVTYPKLLAEPCNAFLSAAVFWNDHSLNTFADAFDVKGCRHAINGGYNGLDECEAVYARARAALGF